ncbi:MAG TPA: PepSY domain-containing protein [Thermoleophilaceae bacterium]
MTRRRGVVLAGAVGLAIAAGAVGVAQAVGGDSDDQSATGPDADRAKQAAVGAVGGGRVTGVEREDEQGEAWEVEVRRSDGREVEVKLDRNFAKSSLDVDDDRGDDVGEIDDEREMDDDDEVDDEREPDDD